MNLVIDMATHGSSMVPSNCSLVDSRRDESYSTRGKKKQKAPLEYSSSSSFAQSFSDFSINDSYKSSQHYPSSFSISSFQCIPSKCK